MGGRSEIYASDGASGDGKLGKRARETEERLVQLHGKLAIDAEEAGAGQRGVDSEGCVD